MFIEKEQVLHIFEEDSLDSRLDVFYRTFGPAVRSEYRLDGSDIVDLDWETSACVVTLVDGSLDQIHFTLSSEDKNVWMGDGVHHNMLVKDIETLFGTSETYIYNQGNYTIEFEFSNLNRIKSVTLNRKS